MSESLPFEEQVQDALAHLYDLAFLERSPLADSLGLPRRRGTGATVHRLIVEAIERLKPPRDVSAEAPDWKLYRALQLRYVRSLSVSAVANELGLSIRQAQRIHVAAVASVATALSDGQWSAANGGPRPIGIAEPREGSATTTDPLLDDEIAAVLASDHGQLQAVPVILRGAVDTIAPMLEARQSSVELFVDASAELRIAPHDLVRPAVVQLLLAALDWGPARQVIVSVIAEGAEIHLQLTVEPRLPTNEFEPDRSALDDRIRVAGRFLATLGGRVMVEHLPSLRIDARLPAEPAPKVLVVEDNPQVSQLFRRYLSGSPFQMVAASNGIVAFDLAIAEQPAVITLDLLLPQRDGWEFLQAVKVHPVTRHMPVIVCSVLRERELALALGAADFLPKPVTQHALLESLRRHALRPRPFPQLDSPRSAVG